MKKVLAALMTVLMVSACGGGGSGGSNTAEADKLLGNFKFVYVIISEYTKKVTLDAKTSEKNSDGEDIYSGYDADYPTYSALAAWSPSLSKYLLVVQTAITGWYYDYTFVIESDGRLTGCFYLSINGSLSPCYALNSTTSHKYSAGAWGRTGAVKYTGKGSDEAESLLRETIGAPSGEKAGPEVAAALGELEGMLQAAP